MGLIFARFAGLVMLMSGVWLFAGNVGLVGSDHGYGPWVLPWILGAGAAGAMGGVFYLVSFDGPDRFRTRRIRSSAWAGMLIGSLVPSIIAPLLLVVVLLAFPTLFFLRTADVTEDRPYVPLCAGVSALDGYVVEDDHRVRIRHAHQEERARSVVEHKTGRRPSSDLEDFEGIYELGTS